jgi:vitamin-K-epoxide reductase (warfarin-sensitive)
LFFTALVGLAFSLYLTRIEAYVLEVWCIYCVASLATITLITISSGITLAMKRSQS